MDRPKTIEELIDERVAAAFKERKLQLNDLPLNQVKEFMEQQWQPNADTMLLPHSVGPDALRETTVLPLTKSNSTYWVDYNNVAPPQTAAWTRMEVVRTADGMCHLRGLFKSATAWNGGVPGTYNNVFTLPDPSLYPVSFHMGLAFSTDTASQKMLIRADINPANGVIFFSYPDLLGTSNGQQSYGTFIMPPWQAIGDS